MHFPLLRGFSYYFNYFLKFIPISKVRGKFLIEATNKRTDKHNFWTAQGVGSTCTYVELGSDSLTGVLILLLTGRSEQHELTGEHLKVPPKESPASINCSPSCSLPALWWTRPAPTWESAVKHMSAFNFEEGRDFFKESYKVIPLKMCMPGGKPMETGTSLHCTFNNSSCERLHSASRTPHWTKGERIWVSVGIAVACRPHIYFMYHKEKEIKPCYLV